MMRSTFRPRNHRLDDFHPPSRYRQFACPLTIGARVHPRSTIVLLCSLSRYQFHKMAAKDGERSASSATRFTATTPHASSKMGSGAATPKSRFQSVPGTGGPRKPPSPARTPTGAETPEQRVARLRAAHEAAKNAKVSRFDQILAKSRPFFDSAHRITVISLVGLTGKSSPNPCS